MGREVITLNVGQCGVQLADPIWRQYCAEHKIHPDGTGEATPGTRVLFEETSEGRLVPRDVTVDLEATTIDALRSTTYGELFNPDRLVSGKEDAANIFARGHYTVGREQISGLMDSLRKMVERSSNMEGFMMHHSVNGGTGSGLGALLIERLEDAYKKRPIVCVDVFPSRTQSGCIVEPYNACLATHWLLEKATICMPMDNEQLYHVVSKSLGIAKPSFSHINKVIAKISSCMTNSSRFPGNLQMDFCEFQLLPFPRLHFMESSFSPIYSQANLEHSGTRLDDLTAACFEPKNFFFELDDFDWQRDSYIGMAVTFRGDFPARAAYSARFDKMMSRVTFSSALGTGGRCKMSISERPITVTSDDEMAFSAKSVTMIGNNCAFGRVMDDRMLRKFDLMYAMRSYVHWYVGEGMEEGEFQEAREQLAFLDKDYRDILNEAVEEDYTDVY